MVLLYLLSFLRCKIAIAAHLVAVVAVDDVAASVSVAVVAAAVVLLLDSDELDAAVVLELLDELDDDPS